MPSKSKSQQRLFGMVHAYQKGLLKHAPGKIKDMSSNIHAGSAEHFAATKHKGLRNKVKKANIGQELLHNFKRALPYSVATTGGMLAGAEGARHRDALNFPPFSFNNQAADQIDQGIGNVHQAIRDIVSKADRNPEAEVGLMHEDYPNTLAQLPGVLSEHKLPLALGGLGIEGLGLYGMYEHNKHKQQHHSEKPMNKESGWYENYRKNEVNKVNGHYSPEEFKGITGIDVKKAAAMDYLRAVKHTKLTPENEHRYNAFYEHPSAETMRDGAQFRDTYAERLRSHKRSSEAEKIMNYNKNEANKVKKADAMDYLRSLHHRKTTPTGDELASKDLEHLYREIGSLSTTYGERLRTNKEISKSKKENVNEKNPYSHIRFKSAEAFDRGFIKAATDLGVNPLLAIKLLKTANGYEQMMDKLGPQGAMNVGTDAVMGGAGGALLGGATGYLGGKNKQHPEQDHSMRDMLLAGLLGGGMGAVGGAAYGMNQEHIPFSDSSIRGTIAK